MFELNHRTKYGLFRLKDVYHADAINQYEIGYDTVYYYYCREQFGRCKKRTTLLIDLTMDEEELIQSFNCRTRQMIRKSIRNDDIKIEIIEKPTREELTQIKDCYERFSHVKQDWYCQTNFFNAHLKMENIIIMKAFYQDTAICWFTYVPHGDTVLVAFGCTVRLFEEIDKSLLRIIGDTHRLLDYCSMLYFKSMGYKTFDFGGLVEREGSDADRYKLGFGGTKQTEYCFMVPYTLKGQLFCWAKLIKEQMKHRQRIFPQQVEREEGLV